MSTSNKITADWLKESNVNFFYNSAFLSDVIVKCSEREWKLHKIILCVRCKWFQKCLLDGNTVESQSGVVEITETDPDDLNRFLEFLYTGEVQEFEARRRIHQESVRFTLLADFFLLPEAEAYGIKHLRRSLASFVVEIQKTARKEASNDDNCTNMQLMRDETSTDFWAGITLAFDGYSGEDDEDGCGRETTALDKIRSAYDSFMFHACNLPLSTKHFMRSLRKHPQFALFLLEKGIWALPAHLVTSTSTVVQNFNSMTDKCYRCNKDPLAKKKKDQKEEGEEEEEDEHEDEDEDEDEGEDEKDEEESGGYYYPWLYEFGYVKDIESKRSLYTCTWCLSKDSPEILLVQPDGTEK